MRRDSWIVSCLLVAGVVSGCGEAASEASKRDAGERFLAAILGTYEFDDAMAVASRSLAEDVRAIIAEYRPIGMRAVGQVGWHSDCRESRPIGAGGPCVIVSVQSCPLRDGRDSLHDRDGTVSAYLDSREAKVVAFDFIGGGSLRPRGTDGYDEFAKRRQQCIEDGLIPG